MQMKNLAVLVALPIALVACGGDSGSSSGGGGIVTPGATINSQFIDAPVKGLKYVIGSNTGFTGNNGIFPCKAGEEVEFRVHNKVIGTASCGEKIFISDVNPGSGNSTDAAAALIQSLSKTVGGVLDLSTFNADPIDVSGVVLTDAGIDGALTSMNTQITDRGLKVVSLTEAQAHVQLNLPDHSQDAVLAGIAAEGPMTLNLTPAATNSEDHCWVGVQVKVNLELVKDRAYRFNVTEYLAYDSETVPQSPVCSTQGGEGGDENGIYECITNPVSKIISGRTVSGTHYRNLTLTRAKGELIACNYEDEYELSDDETTESCTQAGGTPITALDDNNVSFGLGYNFNITATDTNFSVSFVERAVNFVPSKKEGNAVNLTTQPITCRYSLLNDLDLGESSPE